MQLAQHPPPQNLPASLSRYAAPAVRFRLQHTVRLWQFEWCRSLTGAGNWRSPREVVAFSRKGARPIAVVHHSDRGSGARSLLATLAAPAVRSWRTWASTTWPSVDTAHIRKSCAPLCTGFMHHKSCFGSKRSFRCIILDCCTARRAKGLPQIWLNGVQVIATANSSEPDWPRQHSFTAPASRLINWAFKRALLSRRLEHSHRALSRPKWRTCRRLPPP